MYIIHRHRNNKKSNHRTDTSSNGTIRQKSRPHRKHMAGAHTSITINGSYPTVNVHQTILIRFKSTTTLDEPSERSRCSSPYTIASPSTHTKHTSLCTTQTKVMGNHRMHPQEIIIYIIRTSRKIKNLIAKRDEDSSPSTSYETIKNNLHHRT